MSIRFIDKSWRFGFHMPKYSSFIDTVNNIISIDEISSAQIYISNSRSKKIPIDESQIPELSKAREILEKHKEIYLVIHGCLLYNFAGSVNGPTDPNYTYALSSSIQGLITELDVGVALGKPDNVGIGVVIHPGSCKDKKLGHETVSKSLITILTRQTGFSKLLAKSLNILPSEFIKRRKVILENSAGEGTKLCSTLEEISIVIQNVPDNLRDQIKVCIDTAHSFGSGIYDWGKDGEIDRFYNDFDKIIGLKYLEVFHLNDSYKGGRNDAPFGSRKDRHQNLSDGYIFGGDERIKKIAYFIEKAKNNNIPIICEPPGNPEKDFEIVSKLLKNKIVLTKK